MHNLSLGSRHLVNAYEVEAGIGVIAGNTVWSMPEHLECEVLQKTRYTNTLTFTFTFFTFIHSYYSLFTSQVDVQLNSTMCLISGTLRSTPLPRLPVLSNIELPTLRRKAATDKLVEKIVKHDSWPIQPDILSPPLLRLTSRKTLWLDLQPVDIKCRWRHNWKSAQVVNSHLVCDPTIWQPGFHRSWQQWSLLKRFRTEQGHCSAWIRKWRLTDTDLCPWGKIQTMSHMVESCPLTKLNGGLSRLHSADEDTVSWLTNYESRQAYKNKKIKIINILTKIWYYFIPYQSWTWHAV